jgi:hypothetical protein
MEELWVVTMWAGYGEPEIYKVCQPCATQDAAQL